MLSLLFGIQSFVTLLNQVFEESVKHGFGHGTDGVADLSHITTLGDEFVTDLNPGFDESQVESWGVYTQQSTDTITFLKSQIYLSNSKIARSFSIYLSTIGFSLFFTTSLLEFHATHVHYSSSDLVDIVFFLLSETKNIEGFLNNR